MTSLQDLAEPSPLVADDPVPVPDAGSAHRPPPSRRAVLRLVAVAGVATAAPVAAAAAARLDRPGQGSGRPLPTVDPGRFLTVSAAGVALRPSGHAVDAGAHPGHAGSGAPGEPAPLDGLGHRAWTTTVRAELTVENRADRPVPFSPGQVRLRLTDGTTVQPLAWGTGPGPVPPRSRVRLWVDYLAPDPAAPVALDYTPAGRTDPVTLLEPTVPATPGVRP